MIKIIIDGEDVTENGICIENNVFKYALKNGSFFAVDFNDYSNIPIELAKFTTKSNPDFYGKVSELKISKALTDKEMQDLTKNN